jgi:hypothetical protein
MLDEFLLTAYTHETRKKAEYEMVGLLKDIPTLELRKLAAGTPIAELYAKTAYLGDCAPSDSSGPTTFLDKFKDTPFFEEAMALEQEMLEAEAADIAHRVQENSQPRTWEVMDQIRLKKRLLELKLAKEQAGSAGAGGAPPGGAPPGEPAQGAGAPGPVPAEGVQDSSQGLQGGVAKMSAAERVQFSDQFARALARSDFEKAARVEVLLKTGSAAGGLMAKTALPDLAALGGMASKALTAAKPIASKVLGMAAKRPDIAGAALGAGAGALAGGPEHRLSGALGGAALGGAAGHLAGPQASGFLQKAQGALSPKAPGA